MKLLTAKQIRDWDAFTIEHEPITSIDLMERAANACVTELIPYLQAIQNDLSIAVYCGSGNNGGDGLAIARILHQLGYSLKVLVLKSENYSNDCRANLERLKSLGLSFHILENEAQLIHLPSALIHIDALFGTGLNKEVVGLPAKLIEWLNKQSGLKIAIDVPSGMMADVGRVEDEIFPQVFMAQHTFTFQVPKLAFLFSETGKAVGQLHVLDIGLSPKYLSSVQTEMEFLTAEDLPIINPNPFDYKWQKGHALVVGGSYGKIGAVCLSAKAALLAGSGLVSVYAPKIGYTILQTAFPEAMVQTDEALNELHVFPNTDRYAAIGAGVGIGTHPSTVVAFGAWLKHIKVPMVIDADGINACAELMKRNPEFKFPKDCVITPHEREFDRLFGKHPNAYLRLKTAQEKAKQYNLVIVLKGAYTAIVSPDSKVSFNSSGHPLLATAGSGDVLTGMVTASLANGLNPVEAAKKAVYNHGVLAQNLSKKGYVNAIAGDLVQELHFVK